MRRSQEAEPGRGHVDVAANLLDDEPELRADRSRFPGGVPQHIDDLPTVEYESGRLLDRDGSWVRNFALLQRFRTPVPRAFAGAAEPALLQLRILVKTFGPRG